MAAGVSRVAWQEYGVGGDWHPQFRVHIAYTFALFLLGKAFGWAA